MRTTVLLILLLTGCAAMPQLTELGATVTPTTEAEIASCEKLGPVSVTRGGNVRGHNVRAARVLIRNRAAERGANRLIFHVPLDHPDDVTTQREFTAGEELAGAAGSIADELTREVGSSPNPGSQPSASAGSRPSSVTTTRTVGSCGRACVLVTAEAFHCP